MKRRMVRLSVVALIVLAGVMVFGTLVTLAAPSQSAVAGIDSLPVDTGLGVDIYARRLISVPFGIDSSATIRDEGRRVTVTGPGSCSEPGTFRIRVDVTQEATGARAESQIAGDCPRADDWEWSVDAVARGPRSFVEGEARVCAMAITHFYNEGAVVRKWCNDSVVLQ